MEAVQNTAHQYYPSKKKALTTQELSLAASNKVNSEVVEEWLSSMARRQLAVEEAPATMDGVDPESNKGAMLYRQPLDRAGLSLHLFSFLTLPPSLSHDTLSLSKSDICIV